MAFLVLILSAPAEAPQLLELMIAVMSAAKFAHSTKSGWTDRRKVLYPCTQTLLLSVFIINDVHARADPAAGCPGKG